MTSNINIDNIDGTFPITGISNDSQGFRNNFTNIKNNFAYAKRELEDLQNKSVVKSALNGTIIDNSMNGATFNGAEVFDLRETEHNAGTITGTYVLDHSIAHYHSFATNGSITIAFSNLPVTGKVGRFRLKVNLTSINHRITIPESVTQGTSGLLGFDQFNYSISFISTGIYVFEFITVDNGTNFHVQDLTRGSTLAAPTYTLPTASGSILGGVKVGNTLSMNGSGVLDYNLPTASGLVLGGIKIGDPAISGNLFVDVNSALNLLPASATILGGVKVGSGLAVDAYGVLSVNFPPPPPPNYFDFAKGVVSPNAKSSQLYGDGSGKVIGFNALNSTDFPNTYFSGISVAGAGTGAQVAVGWDTYPIPGTAGSDTGAPKLMYFRAHDDNAPDDAWSPWTRVITEYDLKAMQTNTDTTMVGAGGLSFAHDPGGGGGDWAWIKYFAYSGEKTNLEIGVSNDGFGIYQDSINLVSPGGVGVNRQTPRRMLDVNGSGIFEQPAADGTTGAVILAASTGDTKGPILQFVNNSDTRQLGLIQCSDNGDMFIGSGGALRMVVTQSGTTTNVDVFNANNDGLVGIPTVPTATAGTTARLAVAGLVESTNGGFKFPDGTVQNSAASGASGFPQQQGRNGWQKLPNGFIIQWGINEASFSNANPDNPASFLWLPFTVTFPIAFPNYCASVQVQGTPGGPGVDWATAYPASFTTTQFTYVFYDTVQNWTSQTAWMAIGY